MDSFFALLDTILSPTLLTEDSEETLFEIVDKEKKGTNGNAYCVVA